MGSLQIANHFPQLQAFEKAFKHGSSWQVYPTHIINLSYLNRNLIAHFDYILNLIHPIVSQFTDVN